ncbi:MAG: Mg/Co/Ni transporter MgtE with CBS-like protein [Candidatus Magasanikbacteria bacterium GW2011_GWA2_46_17]|uniref:Mg/Co/Ni transporter MgtE with CBS-like protein n=1 Tax=Candidatus Magasanikbacteria bacterium GW2011_GWA2_46_17 TaxID=1619042 RepID=A0A0G1P3Z6_9BACT|nr:MAG: Mg/Co/Ni transporter MgtE with CBS-like protein [Candidatus Magasanikbacteria bacterium GW2011_GWA2_46_17]
MLYFTHILGAKVRDIAEEYAGKAEDVIVRNEEGLEFASVAGVEVSMPKKNGVNGDRYFISANSIEEWGRGELCLAVRASEALLPLPANGGSIYLKKSVLDKQIVDLEGLRVVRVNDLQFNRVQGAMSLVAIDISMRGLLRRLGIQDWWFFNFLKPNLVKWQDVNILGDKLQFVTQAKDLVKLHPADIANIIEKLNVHQGSIVLQSLDKDTAARVLEEIEPDIKKLLVKSLGAERAASLIAKMSTDELVDLIQLLPRQASQDIMAKLPVEVSAQKIKKILEYDEDTAGGLMTTEYLSAAPESSVEEVVNTIKKVSSSFRSIQFVYVTDKEGKFLGVVSMRRLIVADKGQLIKHVMKRERRVPMVKVDYEVTEVAALMTKYNLFSVAVLDKDKKMLGVVTVDDVMRHFMPHA